MTVNFQNSSARAAGDGKQHGFTLVEVIISLILASVALSLVGSTIYSFSQGWDRQGEVIENQDMVRRGASILRRDLRSLRRVSIPGGERIGLEFEANASTLSFVTLTPGYASQEGIVAVRYSVEKRDNEQKLIRRVADYRAGSRLSTLVFKDPVEIVSGVDKVEFAYRSNSTHAQSWQRAWPRSDSLPSLVRLRFSNGAASAYPPAIVSIDTGAEAECVVAPSPPCMISAKEQGQ